MTAARLPVVLIAGYLGAGKTTLVNHLLHHAQGRRVAVLVNDFGSINIDAELIAATADGDEHSAGVISLAGGCLCCSFGDDLVGTLRSLQQRNPPPDVCLIELSGVALPAAVARTVRLVQTVDVVATLVVADAEHIQRQAADRYVGDTVTQQLKEADWLMLNKPDLVTPQALRDTATWLQSAASQARLWAGAVQAVLPELLLGWQDGDVAAPSRPLAPNPTATEPALTPAFPSRPLAAAAAGAAARHKAADLFEARSLVLPATTDLHALGSQLAAPGSGVLRAKALLGGCLLQVAGGRWAVTDLAGPFDDHGKQPQTGHLVLIGLRDRMAPGVGQVPLDTSSDANDLRQSGR